jgi:hypothetical protein
MLAGSGGGRRSRLKTFPLDRTGAGPTWVQTMVESRMTRSAFLDRGTSRSVHVWCALLVLTRETQPRSVFSAFHGQHVPSDATNRCPVVAQIRNAGCTAWWEARGRRSGGSGIRGQRRSVFPAMPAWPMVRVRTTTPHGATAERHMQLRWGGQKGCRQSRRDDHRFQSAILLVAGTFTATAPRPRIFPCTRDATLRCVADSVTVAALLSSTSLGCSSKTKSKSAFFPA